jgi:hypothetical protein
MILFLISLSQLPASHVNRGEPLVITAILDFSQLVFIFDIMCCKNNNCQSFILGVPAQNLPASHNSASANTVSLSASHLVQYGGFDKM